MKKSVEPMSFVIHSQKLPVYDKNDSPCIHQIHWADLKEIVITTDTIRPLCCLFNQFLNYQLIPKKLE